jgi:PAS domain S-box-containing protein
MKTPCHHDHEVAGQPDKSPGASNGKPSETGRPQSRDGLEQRVVELEGRVAELTAQTTGLARANKDLADARKQLQALLDNVPDRIYFKDAQSRFLQVNLALAKRLGVADPAQVIGKTDFDFQLPERAKEFYTDEQRIMQSGEALINKTEKQILPDGKTAWTDTTKVPLRDPEGKIIGLVGINRDITRQKQAEAGQAYEQDLFHTLLDTIPDNVYFKDRESRIVRASKSKVEATLQAVRESYRAAHPAAGPDAWPAHLANFESFGKWLIGKSDFDTYPEAHARAAYEDEQEIMRTGQPVMGKVQKAMLPDGKAIWWTSTKMPWRDKDGQIIGTFGVSSDVTAMKEAEEALSRERLLLRALIDNLPDAIYAKDTAGRKTLANPADLKNLRCKTEAEAIGKSDFDLFSKDLAEKFWADDLKVISGQPVINREEYFFDEDGRKRWLLTSKLPLRDLGGNMVGLIGIGRDITQQKQAEEALLHSNEALARTDRLLQAMLDNIPDWIYFKDTESRILKMGRALAKAMGMADPEAAVGKTDFDFREPDQAREFFEDEQRIIRSGEPLINKTEKQVLANGETGWTSTTKVPLRDPAGTVIGLVGINRDITQQKRAEEALRRSDEKLRQFASRLERSNRELQDFAYVASHDLQEPLRKIVVFGERLKEKNADKFGPESVDYLDRMQKAAGRMQTLITDLLTFSRVTTKAQPFMPVNLAEIAAGVVTDLEGRIEMVKGRVELGTLPIIDAEPVQVRQLLQNLIGNALKFRRPEEPPVVKVEAQILPDPETPGKKLCRLTVSDNCIGFDEKYLDRIFNVFQRLHTRNEYEGTGMGLAIVKKIALYHGGDITAKSKPGEGSTFILTVPAAHPQTADNKTAAGENPSS